MYAPQPSRTRIFVVLALVGAVMFAACSDDGDSAETTLTTAAAETTGAVTTVDDREPGLTLGYLRPAAGVVSQLATAQEAAINMAIGDINDAGGINGGPVELLVVDETLDGDTAASVNQLVEEGAKLILGPVSSTTAKAALEPLTTAGSVACSASATAPDLTTLDESGVFYRTAMPDSFTVNYLADTISADAEAAALPEGTPYKVTVVARNDDYGIGVGNGLAATLTARGMEVNVIDYAPRQGIFTTEAADVVATAANTVVMVSYGEGVRLVDTLIGAGVAPTSLIGLDGMFDPNLAQRASNTDPSRLDGVRVIGATGDRAFLNRLAETPDLTQFIYAAQAYDCAIIAALAAQTAGSSETAAFAPQLAPVTEEGQSCSTVADCLDKIAAGEDVDYQGASGGIAFDEAGDPSEVRITTATFADGEMTEVSSSDLSLDELRQQEALTSAIFTSRVQQLLTVLGFYSGPIDGVWSDEMTASMAALQTSLGVPVTGVYDEATDAALREKYGNIMGAITDSTAGLQQLLTDLGFYSGPIDGIYSQAVVDAVKAMQRQLGVPETGIVDAATLKAAYEQGLVDGTPGSTVPPTTPPTTAPPASTTPPTTVAPEPPPGTPTILETLQDDGRFTTFVELITNAGFTADQFSNALTVFAPTDDAFDALDPAVLADLQANPDKLLYHLIDGAVISLSFLATLTSVNTAYGLPLTVSTNGSTVLVNDIATADEQRASNGVVIAIDGVLVPPAG